MFLQSIIVALEGPDRVGKATQTNMLLKNLLEKNYKVRKFEVPINDVLTYKLIYWMLDIGLAKRFPNLFQTVQFFNKYLFQLKLLFLRFSTDVIILDRWSLSSVIYGQAAGANKTYIKFLYWFLREPDITFVLHGKSRSESELQDSYESDTVLQKRVRELYYAWCLDNDKFYVIDNSGSKEDVHNRIDNILAEEFDL